MAQFFANHDWVEVVDFWIAGLFAAQLLLLPEMLFSQSLVVDTFSREFILNARFAGLFLSSERFCFYHMIHSGHASLKQATSFASVVVWVRASCIFCEVHVYLPYHVLSMS